MLRNLLRTLSYNDEDYNLRILLRVFLMCSRGFLRTILSKGKYYYPLFFSRNVQLIGNKSNLLIGKMTKIESNVVIHADCEKGIVINNGCTIGSGTNIRPSGFYGGNKGAGLILGKNSAIGINSFIGCSGFIKIGDDVIVGPHLTMIAENHIFSDHNIPIKHQGVNVGTITIEDNVWIGCNVTILSNVTIGSGSVIAAGSVVNKSFPSNSLIAGVPAKFIRQI